MSGFLRKILIRIKCLLGCFKKSMYPELEYQPTVFLGLKSYPRAVPQQHVAFIYENNFNTLSICHLTGDFSLENTLFIDTEKFLVKPLVFKDDSNDYMLSNYLEIVHDDGVTLVPYGIINSGNCFCPNTGKFLGLVLGEGLTCATFVLTILETLNLHMLDKNSWTQRQADMEWQMSVVGYIFSRDQLRAMTMKNSIGKATRFRPEEVFAAACVMGEPRWKVTMQDVEGYIDQIFADLECA